MTDPHDGVRQWERRALRAERAASRLRWAVVLFGVLGILAIGLWAHTQRTLFGVLALAGVPVAFLVLAAMEHHRDRAEAEVWLAPPDEPPGDGRRKP